MASAALSYFLNSRRDIPLLETIEISHPAFTKTYRKVRNHTEGLTVRLEDLSIATFDYYPMAITELKDQADLDFAIRVDFGDLGEVLPLEMDAISSADAMSVKPKVVYRAYRADDHLNILIGPLRLEVNSFNFTREGASFEAAAPYVNRNKTGETYNLTRFFMLRGFLK